MQIFLSHSSKQKPLIREVKSYFPSHLNAWLDEEKLLFGDSVPKTLEETIKRDSDYVLLFIDRNAAESGWVYKELHWALQAEKDSERIILLPIVVEDEALGKMLSDEIKDRKHLRLDSFRSDGVKTLAERIVTELFALICRDMQELRSPTPRSRTIINAIANTDQLLRAQASMIQKAVFPHRRANPISKEKLAEVIRTIGEMNISDAEFDTIL